jgi:hypothetical protein
MNYAVEIYSGWVILQAKFHDDRIEHSSDIKVIISKMRGCNVGITDGRDL